MVPIPPFAMSLPSVGGERCANTPRAPALPKSGEPQIETRSSADQRREKANIPRPCDQPPALNFKRKHRREAANWLQRQSLPGGGGRIAHPSALPSSLKISLIRRCADPGVPCKAGARGLLLHSNVGLGTLALCSWANCKIPCALPVRCTLMWS